MKKSYHHGADGSLDTTDAAALKAVFDSIDEAIETIKVSFIMHSSK